MHQWEVGWECPECHLKRGADGHDPCLGYLPSVKYACCGHGGKAKESSTDGYIFFENGVVVRFVKATAVYHKDDSDFPVCKMGRI